MKKGIAGCLVAGLLFTVGCNQATGPNSSGSPRGAKEKVGDVVASDKFTVSGPSTSTTIKQGQTKDIAIKVKKGSNFKQDIKLTLEPEKGLKVDPGMAEVKASDAGGDVTLRVTAEESAPVGNLHIKVRTEPPADKEVDIPVKVEKP